MLIRIVFVFLIATFAALTAAAQTAPVSTTNLALEIYFYSGEPPTYQPVRSLRSLPARTSFYRFKKIPDWTAPSGFTPVTAVNIQSIEAGEKVKVALSVDLGPKHLEKPLAVYTLSEGEKISLEELRDFGLEAFAVALIRVGVIGSELPQVVSKAKSIEVITIQQTVSPFPGFRLAVRNLSTKNALALVINVRQGNLLASGSMPQGKDGRPLIVAGGTSEILVRGVTRATATAGVYEPVALRNQTIEIAEVAFDDGSTEGEPKFASRYGELLKNRKVHSREVIDLFQAALRDDSTTLQLRSQPWKIK